MTRQEFINDVSSWWELIDFCNDEGCDICSDVVDDDYKDEYVNEHLTEWARENTWQDLLDILRNIPDDSNYYRFDDYGDLESLDDYSDFENYKEDVLNWADDRECWDEEDEEDEYEVEEEPAPVAYEAANDGAEDEDEFDASEPFTILDLVSTSQAALQAAEEAREAAEAEEESRFVALIQTA